MTTKKAMVHIPLDVEARKHLDLISKRLAMRQGAVVTRLVQWFSQQDDYIVTEVLQSLSNESMASLAKSRLRELNKPGV
jgi:hypothetical protein